MRSKALLKKIGAQEGKIVLLGCDAINFRGFEDISVPLIKFEGSKNDCHLYEIERYLGDEVFNAIKESNLEKKITDDILTE